MRCGSLHLRHVSLYCLSVRPKQRIASRAKRPRRSLPTSLFFKLICRRTSFLIGFFRQFHALFCPGSYGGTSYANLGSPAG